MKLSSILTFAVFLILISGRAGWAALPETGQRPTLAQLDEVNQAIEQRFPHLTTFKEAASKCIDCHEEQLRLLNLSIHGQAGLLKAFPSGMMCLTCHETNHYVRDPSKVMNSEAAEGPHHGLHSDDVACMRCHQDKTIAKVFSFPPYVPGEFEQTIHYRKAMLGDRRAPLCFDCHGGHSVKAIKDPGSSVFEGQKTKVCASCHSGANTVFASTFDHKPTSSDSKPMEYWTTFFFKILTLGTFLALSLFILMDVFTFIRHALTPARKKNMPHLAVATDKVRYVKRLDGHLRLQHFLMLTSVITLAITGWPMFEPNSASAHALAQALGGPIWMPRIHRAAGVIMIGDLFYHLVYLYWRFRAGGRSHPMLPQLKDIADLWHLLLYFLGLRPKKPEFEQFSFIEKFDYWAVFWGVAMMGVTGVILMFPTIVTRIFPAAAVKLSLIVHADEALLAATVLFIWHFYNVHLKPGIFPMNWAWLTGRMRTEIYEEEHAAHVKKLKASGQWDKEVESISDKDPRSKG